MIRVAGVARAPEVLKERLLVVEQPFFEVTLGLCFFLSGAFLRGFLNRSFRRRRRQCFRFLHFRCLDDRLVEI